MTKTYFFFLLCILGLSAHAQTVTAINPTGDGGFETGTSIAANGWGFESSVGNVWRIGNAAGVYSGSRCVFISNDNGTSNLYTTTSSTTSHIFKDVSIPSGATSITLSFYINGSGETGFDRLLVYTAPNTIVPNGGTPASPLTTLTGATLVYTQSAFYSSYTLQTITLPNTLAGSIVRLIFTWQNNASGGTNPPIAIDNISLTYTPQPVINPSTSSLYFGTFTPSTCSPVQTFSINGAGLSGYPGNLNITAPTNYQVSPDGGATWVTSYNISYTGPTLSATTVIARFCPPTVGTFCGGNITISGGGATTVNVAVCGYGATTCTGIPTTGTASVTPTSGANGTTFTLNLTGSTVASGLSYQWQSSPTGTAGAFTDIAGATTTPYSFTGISATTYYRCVITCPTFTSAASNTISATYALPTYCTPAYGTSCTGLAMPCSIASLTGISSSITDPATTCGSTGANYTDRYPTMSVTLAQGSSYTANIGGNIYGSNCAVQLWIDYNDDGILSSPSETIGGGITASTASSGANPMTLTIPATATLGIHRMRIVGNYYSCCGGSNYPGITSCPTSSITYGETRDYKVVIQASCAPPVTGTYTVCIGSTTTLSSSTSGGTWSSSNTAVGTVSSGGVITGIASGTTTISYVISSSCYTTLVITVNPSAGAITGTASVCVGNTTTLSNAISGGTWSSSNTAIATVTGSTGVVSGVAAGTSTISYVVSTGCGSVTATRVVTVNANPAAIGGTFSVCLGGTTTLTNSTPGGTWYSGAPAIATVGVTTGIVTGISAPSATLIYYAVAGCFVSAHVTVNPSPASITGTLSVCSGSTTTLASTTSGGTWSSSNTAVGTVSTTGVVTGITAGTTTISYTLGTCSATAIVTVNTPSAGTLSGTATVCISGTTTLSSTISGGTWSSSNTAIATVAGSTGMVTGVSAGTAIMSYTVSSTCGTATATRTVTVNASPSAGSITGASSVCAGNNITLSNATGGGAWSSASTGIATVNSSGVVTGVTAGVAVISYTVSSSCGTVAATKPVTVNASPATITGTTVICAGSTTTLGNTVTGGTWSSSATGIATINATTGLLAGISAGTTNITYSVSGCYTTTQVTVNTALTGSISGAINVCVGGTTTFTFPVTGGVWTSSNTSLAIVNTTTGIITGVAAGTPTITYTVGACYKTKPITVNAPGGGSITGNTNVCVGSTTVLSYPTSGTSWTSSNPVVATIGVTSGVVTGVAVGTSLISYLGTTGCGSSTVVNVLPLPTPITGTFTFCQGSTSTLSSTGTPGGTWTSSNVSKATVVPSTGVVTGVGGGTATISYTWTNSCLRTADVTINPLPVAGAIVGVGIVHVGSSTTLSPSSVGGVWASGNPAIATVTPGSSSTCTLTGVSAGSVVISYTNTNGCGSATVTRIFSIVFPRPGGQMAGAGGSNIFSVFPNPTSGDLTIETPMSGTFSLYTIDGRFVQQYEIKEISTSLTLPKTLAPGIYMCRFNGDDGSTVMVRLVYEH